MKDKNLIDETNEPLIETSVEVEDNKKIKWLAAIMSSVFGLALILIAFILGDKMAQFLVYFLDIAGAIVLFIGVGFFYSIFKKESKKLSVKQMTLVGIMSSISVILYYFIKTPLPFFPPWLDIQVSEIPALIAGFAYGPYAGVLVIFVRFIIKLPATITVGVGELADLILSATLVLISSIIYSKNRTIKGALTGTIIGVITCTILSIFVNWFILIPAYINIAHFPLPALANMLNGEVQKLLDITITPDNFMFYYLLIGVLPFNFIRYVIVAVLTFLLYKRTHLILKRLAK